jgi:hypothetical protein
MDAHAGGWRHRPLPGGAHHAGVAEPRLLILNSLRVSHGRPRFPSSYRISAPSSSNQNINYLERRRTLNADHREEKSFPATVKPRGSEESELPTKHHFVGSSALHLGGDMRALPKVPRVCGRHIASENVLAPFC